MIHLPRNVPPDLRSAIEPALSGESLQEFFVAVAPSLLRVFAASDIFLLFESISADHRERISYLGNKTGAKSAEATASFTHRWLEADLHFFVSKDLVSRLSAVSFSAFSWPYPRLVSASAITELGFSIPREYTLALPFCSDFVVRSDREEGFFGYFVLFYDGFPTLGETMVQSIISLPELLSEVIASLQRESGR